jgi:acetoacetate decarboxylase
MSITTDKHYIKYIRIVDNTGYENYLEQGQVYGVLEHMTGDIACYYKLDVESPYKEGCWISVGRCSDMPTGYPFRGGELKHTIDLQSMIKPTVERIICIPDENGHIVDLQRVQYVSPVDKGSYKVTLVSGWEMPLTDKLYSREKLIGLWRMLQNK